LFFIENILSLPLKFLPGLFKDFSVEKNLRNFCPADTKNFLVEKKEVGRDRKKGFRGKEKERRGERERESFASHSEVEALSAERGNLADSYFGALFVCTLFFL
jgi:hypothetical protein